MMTRIIVRLLQMVSLAIVSSIASAAPMIQSDLDAAAMAGATVAYSPSNGLLRFIGAPAGASLPSSELRVMTKQSVTTQTITTPETWGPGRALDVLRSYGPLFGLQDPDNETKIIKSRVNSGMYHARHQQVHMGIPVIAGELITNFDAQSGALRSVSGRVSPNLDLSIIPTITQGSAEQAALNTVVDQYGVPASSLAIGESELSVYDPALMGPQIPGPVRLVWRIMVDSPTEPIDEFTLIDAQTGTVVLHFNQVPDAMNRQTGDAHETGFASSSSWTLVCDESNPTCSGGSADAFYAHQGAKDTYNFYWTQFGRDSIDGHGMPIVSIVHYCEPASETCPEKNAHWTQNRMVYGDGLPVALDVAGHEMTHGVTSFESRLFYYYQSGAINEGLSDIFGRFVELTSVDGLGNTDPAKRWLIGADLVPTVFAQPLRNMADPTLDPDGGDPDRITSPYFDTNFVQADHYIQRLFDQRNWYNQSYSHFLPGANCTPSFRLGLF
jgi:bacillolysin